MKPEESRDLVKIATWYYHHGWTQAAIAKKMGVSRSLIAKKLQDAKDNGLIEIFIKDESYHTVSLEQKLEEKFQLEEAIVVPTGELSEAESLSLMAKRASYYLSKRISSVQSIGISWGKTIRKFVDEFPYINCENLTIIPLIGGMGAQNIELHSNQICYDLQKKTNGQSKYLYAPALVDDQKLKDDLVKNQYISEVLEEGKKVDMAIVGVSSLNNRNTMKEIGYLSSEDVEHLLEKEVVGDINSRFYTEMGKEATSKINDLVIGQSLEDLKKIPIVIALANEFMKKDALKTALSKGLIDIVVLTDKLAEYVIK